MSSQPQGVPTLETYKDRIQTLSKLYWQQQARITELEEQKCSLAYEVKETQERLDSALGRVQWLEVRVAEANDLVTALQEQVVSLGCEPHMLTLEEEEEEEEEEEKEEVLDEDAAEADGPPRPQSAGLVVTSASRSSHPDLPVARPSKSPRLL